MKTRNKALLLTLCAILLVVTSVFGTLAYMTDRQTVTNTFTVGNIDLDLDEEDVNPDGTPTGNPRDQENEYHLVPGHQYTKDPTVHISETSESSWVFVTVENGIEAYEAATGVDYTNIAGQILANRWNVLDTGVYYKEYIKGETEKDLVVFSEFKIADDANTKENWDTINNGANGPKIIVNAYAIQMDGFENDAAGAWAAVCEAYPAN